MRVWRGKPYPLGATWDGRAAAAVVENGGYGVAPFSVVLLRLGSLV